MSLLVAETLSGSTTRTEREVSTDDLALVDAWWRTANYLAIGCWGTEVHLLGALRQHATRRGRHAAVPAVSVPRRRPQPRLAGDARLES
jgi:hypothetical protein